MKRMIFSLVLVAALGVSCNTGQKSVGGLLNVLKADWVLQSLTGQSNLGSLFGEKLPTMKFDTDAMKVAGNNGCNNFNGAFTLLAGGKLDLGQLATTRMSCPGGGEAAFMDALKKVTNLKVKNNVLQLTDGVQTLMSFAKK